MGFPDPSLEDSDFLSLGWICTLTNVLADCNAGELWTSF